MLRNNLILGTGMSKIELFSGVLIGLTASFIGSFLFIHFFTEMDFAEGLSNMQGQGYLGKIITLGSLLNLVVFTILLKYNKDIMAKGIILAVIIMALLTLFI